MLTQTEQHVHQRIVLFSTFSLVDVMNISDLILSEISGRVPVKHSYE